VYTLARWTALGSLLALGGLAVLGYYYTALQLTCRVQVTIWLVLGLIVAKFLLLRWLLVARSKLAIQQAQRRRAAAMATPQGAAQDGGRSATSTGDMLLDLTAIDLQSRRLVRGSITLALIVGLWGIWVGVLPALKYLDQWQLWTYTETVTVPTAPGETPQGPSTVLRSITLRDLLLSVAIVVMTVVASRNLPGLIEIAWLRRLPLDPGGRYAITSISRYIIVVVGVVGAFRSVGIGWSNVQWLAAAITVGLGFGLQEIFANLISGLIILFERPMRVGDTVTVAGVSGTVTRIRSRATTITDWDRKELIVPNKEFITGQLVNWTLSDSVLRAVVHVGTSYGSDPTEVVQLLYEMAHNHPMVLADPRPTAVLAGFGDSSLNFELRVFVAGTDKLVPVQHDLHVQIEERFRQAGIEIPFPQCDVRVRDLPKGLVVQPAHAGSEVRPLHFATRAFVAEPGK
jgi:potassium efflux system protein